MTVSTENKLLSFAEARHAVEQHAATLAATETELTGLLDAVGLVLAEDLLADRDFPPFPAGDPRWIRGAGGRCAVWSRRICTALAR